MLFRLLLALLAWFAGSFIADNVSLTWGIGSGIALFFVGNLVYNLTGSTGQKQT